jgi:hypothetical protein
MLLVVSHRLAVHRGPGSRAAVDPLGAEDPDRVHSREPVVVKIYRSHHNVPYGSAHRPALNLYVPTDFRASDLAQFRGSNHFLPQMRFFLTTCYARQPW